MLWCKHQILNVTSGDHWYNQFNARFANTACSRPVKAKDVQAQHQSYLVDQKDL